MFDALGPSRGGRSPLPSQRLHPPGWQPPVGYANGISVAAGQMIFIAGQVGWDAEQKFRSELLVPQFEQALRNILVILAQAGGEASHICRITAFCIDKPAYLVNRRELGRIWKSLMGNHYPAMSMIFVNDLLDSPAKIELEATAVVPVQLSNRQVLERGAARVSGPDRFRR